MKLFNFFINLFSYNATTIFKIVTSINYNGRAARYRGEQS